MAGHTYTRWREAMFSIGVLLVVPACGGGNATVADLTWTIDGETQSATLKSREGLVGDVGMVSRLRHTDDEPSGPNFDVDVLLPRTYGAGLVLRLGASRPGDVDAWDRVSDNEVVMEVTDIAFDGRAPLTLRGTIETTEFAAFEASGTFETMPRCWNSGADLNLSNDNNAGCGTNLQREPAVFQPGVDRWTAEGVFPSQIGDSVFQTSAPPLCDPGIVDPIVGDLSLEQDLPKRLSIGGRELDCSSLKAGGLDYAFCHDEEQVETADCTFDVKVYNDDRFIIVTGRAVEECSLPRNCVAMFSVP